MKGIRKIPVLCLAGAVLMLAGLIALLLGPRTIQYAFAPHQADYVSLLKDVEKRWDGAYQPVALHEMSGGVSVSSETGSQNAVTLYQVGGSYFQAYPRLFLSGRPISSGDAGNQVIVLDRQLAFLLFGDQDALDQRVRIGEAVYTVVGTAEHARRIGETGENAAWIPLGTEKAPEGEIMVLTASGIGSGGAKTVFETAANDVFGNGETLDLGKEAVRGMILLFVFLGGCMILLLGKWMRMSKRLCSTWMENTRTQLKTRYPRQILGWILLRILGAVLVWALFAGGAALMVTALGRLMLLFPEWVPEELLSVSAGVQRFWSLTAESARPVHWRTPELAEIRFWSGMVRWGVMIFLLGFFMRTIGSKHHPDPASGASG